MLSFSLLIQLVPCSPHSFLIPVVNQHLETRHFRVVLIIRSLKGPEEKHPKLTVTRNQLF